MARPNIMIGIRQPIISGTLLIFNLLFISNCLGVFRRSIYSMLLHAHRLPPQSGRVFAIHCDDDNTHTWAANIRKINFN